jgi:YD repeat-containing protein
MDVDWMGRTIAAAPYTTEPSNWSTLESSYDAWVNHTNGATGRNFLTVTSYDDLGRVFRTDFYPGTEATNHIEVNNFYDRNDRLVARGDKHAAHMEYAYDGAGRRYQERTVLNLESTKYSSGAFDYVEPAPHPVLASMSGTGDDGLIEFTHNVFDAAGNATEEHVFELHHTDTNGIDIDASSYVRASTYSWYDGADRMTAMADYGSGDATSGPGVWQYVSTVPTRPSSAPGYTHADVTAGRALLTTYAYESDSGRLSIASDPLQAKTKAFYDDLNRRTFVAENHNDFSAPTTGIGGGTNNEQDRVTKFEYNAWEASPS